MGVSEMRRPTNGEISSEGHTITGQATAMVLVWGEWLQSFLVDCSPLLKGLLWLTSVWCWSSWSKASYLLLQFTPLLCHENWEERKVLCQAWLNCVVTCFHVSQYLFLMTSIQLLAQRELDMRYMLVPMALALNMQLAFSELHKV